MLLVRSIAAVGCPNLKDLELFLPGAVGASEFVGYPLHVRNVVKYNGIELGEMFVRLLLEQP